LLKFFAMKDKLLLTYPQTNLKVIPGGKPNEKESQNVQKPLDHKTKTYNFYPGVLMPPEPEAVIKANKYDCY